MATQQPFVPFGLQTEQAQLQRRRKMAEAMMQMAMQQQAPQPMGGPYAHAPRMNPLQAITQVLAGTMAQKRMNDADVDETILGQRMETAQLAERERQQKQAVFKQIADAVASRATPESARNAIQAQDPSAFQFNTPELVPGMLNGNPYLVGTDEKGNKRPYFPPKGTSVTVDTIGKAGGKVNEEQGKNFAYGGKLHEQFQNLSKQMQSGANLLQTLEQGAQMGAGGELLQDVRKWAQTLGAPVNDVTTPTELARMQLGQKVLERLGGLGAQVSDADRQFMLQVQGSLGSDPEAVRQLVMLEQKYLMQVAGELSEGRQRVGDRFGDDVPLPDYHYQFAIPPRLQQEFERILMGQPPQLRKSQPTAVQPPAATSPMPGRFKPVQ